MQHQAVVRLGRLLPLNPEPGSGTVYAAPGSACLPWAEAGTDPASCACSVHFGHHGKEWVLQHDGQGTWAMGSDDGGTFQIQLGRLGEDPDLVADAVKAALPPRPPAT